MMRLPHRTRGTGTVPAWLPQQHGWQRRETVVWGAHGGAGTTTLAGWLQPARDTGAIRSPPGPPYPAELVHGQPLLITCRNTATAACLATTALAAVTRHGGHVTAVIVISDGWPEPAAATCRFRLLHPHTAVIRVPFIPALRTADVPASVPLPRRARRALAQIRALTGGPSPASPENPQEH
jgi:hypothetical protein